MSHHFKLGAPPSKHDEKLSGIWFEFGVHPDGTVDVSDSNGDVVIGCPKTVADKLIELRWKFISDVEKILSDGSDS